MAFERFRYPLLTMLTLAAAFTALLGAQNANALTIDFESLAHGEVANGTIDGVTISAFNARWNSAGLAVGFDSRAYETLGTTADTDLQAGNGANPWSGGNIAGEELGTFLILQENNTGCGSGICSSPDDEGRRPAGSITFDFSIPVVDFGFDAVDIEGLIAENATLDFTGNGVTRTVSLMEFFDSTSPSPLYDPTLVLGNNTANRYSPISIEFLDLSRIDQVVLNLGGSGAIDNLYFTPVPEPGSALLVGTGLAALAARRRKRDA